MSDKIELRAVVTDSLVSMIASVTGLTPPKEGGIPPFIQAAIDRAVERIDAIALAQQPAPVAVPDGWICIDPDGSFGEIQSSEADARDLASDCDAELPPHHAGPAHRVAAVYIDAAPAAPVAVGQEPVTWINHQTLSERASVKFGSYYLSPERSDEDDTPLYAAPPAAEQPDAVMVPRHTLARYADHLQTAGYNNAADDLRALLIKDGEA